MRRAIAALVVGLLSLAGADGAAGAQVDCILDPTNPACEETTTTEAPARADERRGRKEGPSK
jgi:hypothetical protein